MTLRERIADWISGGALTSARSKIVAVDDKHWETLRKYVDADNRLNRIAAEETPKANATVKRMAAIARGER